MISGSDKNMLSRAMMKITEDTKMINRCSLSKHGGKMQRKNNKWRKNVKLGHLRSHSHFNQKNMLPARTQKHTST